MALTKVQIIEKVMKRNGFTREKSTETVEILLELIKRSLESGEDVLISGFGKFCIREKKERRGRNPATGEDMMLRPRKVVTFKCSGNDEIKPENHKVEDLKLSDTYEQDHKKKNRYLEFITDFITGFSALIVIGLILFIVIPVLLILLKIGAFLVIPISLLGAFIILIALLGKLIRQLLTKRS